MFEENEDGRYYDLWINDDSPDTQFIEVDVDGNEDSLPAVLMSFMDPAGTPIFGVFDLESIGYLIDRATEAKSVLQKMQQQDNDE